MIEPAQNSLMVRTLALASLILIIVFSFFLTGAYPVSGSSVLVMSGDESPCVTGSFKDGIAPTQDILTEARKACEPDPQKIFVTGESTISAK
ncbi:MAG: hypothetical protein RBR82_16235 [Pseudomonas sp.]|nr:hypothetical protein [Pseudomonas sp.]